MRAFIVVIFKAIYQSSKKCGKFHVFLIVLNVSICWLLCAYHCELLLIRGNIDFSEIKRVLCALFSKMQLNQVFSSTVWKRASAHCLIYRHLLCKQGDFIPFVLSYKPNNTLMYCKYVLLIYVPYIEDFTNHCKFLFSLVLAKFAPTNSRNAIRTTSFWMS